MSRPFQAEAALMIRLTTAQNHPANSMIDIMTFTAFFDTREELERHVVRYEEMAARYVPPTCRRRAA